MNAVGYDDRMNDSSATLTVNPMTGGLVVAGEIDSSTIEVLRGQIKKLEVGSSDIVLNMSEVQFIDSSGLRVIIEAHQDAEKTGGRLIIAEPSPVVARLFEISGLADYLNIQAITS